MKGIAPDKAAQVLERCRQDPAWFAENVLGVHWWSMQVRVAECVRDHERTSVKAANGVGKTFNAAGLLLWFLYCFPQSRVVTTATTWPQVEKLLWHEVGQIHRGARFPLGGQLNLTELKLPDGRYAIGLSTKPTDLESFQGHHAPNLLLIFDEASGIPAPIYEAGEGYLTARGARLLLIGNPTQVSGEFYASHNSKRGDYKTFTIGWSDTPAFTGEPCPQGVLDALPYPEKLEQRKRMWGEDSALYQVRVLGNFSPHTTSGVIPLGAVMAAQARMLPSTDSQYDHVVISCDVARFGDDETVIAERVGQTCRIVERYVGRKPAVTATGSQHGDLVQTAGRIAEHASKHPRQHVRLVVDDTGVGGGVTDILRNDGWEVTAFNGGETAFNPLRFPNRRSELWFMVGAQLEDIDLDDDDQLAADLVAPEYSYDLKMRKVVERKEDTKKRLGRSPDRADAVNLLFVPGEIHIAKPQKRVASVTGDLMADNSF